VGITVAYRGRLADLSRVEDFEDRLVDLALEVGGLAQLWRSYADDDPGRVVRGVILDLAPGLESTSLLLSPEGWLIGLVDIEDAEQGRLKEPPWCFTKTQFGPIEAHVALVEMLTELRREFLPDLEVSDDGGYYPTRDLAQLTRRHAVVQGAIDGLADGLRRHGLSREAAEDPDILLKRIERIAAQVHRILRRPAEHPPVTFSDDEDPGELSDPDATEAVWDEMFKHNRRQQERLQRAIEERMARGETEETAFENALEDLGLEPPGDSTELADQPWDQGEEPFAASPGEADLDDVDADDDEQDDAPFGEERHPLLLAAMDLLKHLHEVFRAPDKRLEPALRTLFHGAGDTMGGLAQALSGEEADDPDDYGLRVTQMKRALRGVAFARGALFQLRSAVTAEQFDELYDTFSRLEQGVFREVGRLRSEHGGDGG
jgi:hypothetical protein